MIIDRGAPISWRTPHGHQARRPAADLRPADRMPPPPEPVERWTDDIRWQLRAAAAATQQPNPPPPPHYRFDDPPPF